MPHDFKPADVVKIHRPGKAQHGWIGRFLDPDKDQPKLLGWVAFSTARGPNTTPPDERNYRRNTVQKCFPLSQLQPHAADTGRP